MLRRIKPSNYLLKLLKVHETKNSIYLIFEYIKGGTLKHFVKQHETMNNK